VASTIGRYLSQIATILAPASVDAADLSLRQFARYLIDHEPHIDTVAAVDRDVAEDYKVWLAAQPGHNGQCLSVNSRRQRLGMIRAFFERIIEWDWPDAPARNPLILGDLPAKPEPLPKFLTDRDAARLMAAAKTDPDPRRRLVVEVLARTGLRASELCDLAADAIVRIGQAHWLRVPLGKLRNDRYVPLHPTSSTCSPTGPPPTKTTSASTGASSPTTAGRSTATKSAASSVASAAPPASTTSTPTSSATPSPPKPSTAACASKPSPPCSATAPSR